VTDPEACGHDSASVEYHNRHGPVVEFWITCRDCGGYWTLKGELDREIGHLSREETAPPDTNSPHAGETDGT
jgi:Zn-finger nucleic acid-binding protein